MDILGIYCWNIHGIYMDIPCISASMDIHGIYMYIPCIYHVYVSGLHIHGIYYVYTRYILKIGVPDAVLVCTGMYRHAKIHKKYVPVRT